MPTDKAGLISSSSARSTLILGLSDLKALSTSNTTPITLAVVVHFEGSGGQGAQKFFTPNFFPTITTQKQSSVTRDSWPARRRSHWSSGIGRPDECFERSSFFPLALFPLRQRGKGIEISLLRSVLTFFFNRDCRSESVGLTGTGG